jgi:hypothetical protein
MAKIRQILASFSFFGFSRYLWLQVIGKEPLVTGRCHNCGDCCRRINLEGKRGWLRSKDDFIAVAADYPEYERFQLIGKDNQGFLLFSCTWLTEEGHCREHKNRLDLCRNFPDKTLHFCGAILPPRCGYMISEVRPFKKYLADALGE